MEDDKWFALLLHFPDGTYHVEKRQVTAEEAVTTAHDFTRRPAAVAGFIDKIQIVALSDDATVFMWEHGKGVTFPPKQDVFTR